MNCTRCNFPVLDHEQKHGLCIRCLSQAVDALTDALRIFFDEYAATPQSRRCLNAINDLREILRNLP